jgi:diguanylate cyclase (GGDEF)-like protein
MNSADLTTENVLLQCSLGDNSCQYLRDITQLRAQVALLQEQARTDALTGLYNFRFFSDTLALEMERAQRAYQPLCLVILDVDHFKLFNDTWGHELGNQALVHIAKLMASTLRKLDYACRFGGEEFVLILPNTDLRQARNVAERLREMIAQTPLLVGDETIPITASLGVDEYRAHSSDSPESFLERVDAWLYQAKHAGRNRVAAPDVIHTKPLKTAVSHDEKDALFSLFEQNDDSASPS